MLAERLIFCYGRLCSSQCPYSESFAREHGFIRDADICNKVREEYEYKACTTWINDHNGKPDSILVRASKAYGIDLRDFMAKFQDMEWV